MSYILSGTFFALSLAEMYSIIGNAYEIRTGKKVTEYDAVALILSKMLGIIKNRLDKIDPKQNQHGDDNK